MNHVEILIPALFLSSTLLFRAAFRDLCRPMPNGDWKTYLNLLEAISRNRELRERHTASLHYLPDRRRYSPRLMPGEEEI